MRQRSFLILSVLALLFASCGKKGGNSGLLVPKDAAIVIHINSSSLSSKLSWEEIRQTNWFKQMSKETTDTMAQRLLADPSSSGVDIKDDFVFYMKKQGRGGYMIFQGSLNDAGNFEKLNKEIDKNREAEVKKDGDFSIMQTKDGSVVWNKSRFAYITNVAIPDMKGPLGGNRGSEEKAYEFTQDSLKIFALQALTLKNSDNLDTDSRFASLVKDGSDVHFWMNVAQYYNTGMGPMLSMMKLSVLLQDNISTASMNFDNGRITAKSRQYFGDEMNKLLSKYKPENVSADLINRIPSQNVAGVLAFNYPPQGMHELLKVIGVDGMANGFLAQMDYSVEEFIKATKGEMLIAVSDVAIVNKMDTVTYGTESQVYPRQKTDMKFLFATAVNDKASFQKLVNLIGQSSKDYAGKMPPISSSLENNWFALSNSAEHKDKFLAGGSNKFPFTDKITGHPMGAYIDLQKLIQSSGSFAGSDSSGKAAVDASLNMWQDIVATGGEYKDKALHYDFEINLVDKNTNSLKQLNQYFDKLSLIKGEKRKKYDNADIEKIMLDSVAAPEPAVR